MNVARAGEVNAARTSDLAAWVPAGPQDYGQDPPERGYTDQAEGAHASPWGKGGDSMKRKLAAVLLAVALSLTAAPAFADAGGGPGSNHGCPGHQPPPPPGGGCGN